MNHSLLLPPERRAALSRALPEVSTPCYVYTLDPMLDHIDNVASIFESKFNISYAIKSNPNEELIKRFKPHINLLDASSIGEVEVALRAGYSPSEISFSGPAKRLFELERAASLPGLKVVCESLSEMQTLNQLAEQKQTKIDILLRLNPLNVPRSFGINMAGAASPFGIDEETLEAVAKSMLPLKKLNLIGFHIYSATNSRNIEAITENFNIFLGLFEKAANIFSINPQYLIFGAGFGIPYTFNDEPLNLEDLAEKVLSKMEDITSVERLKSSQCILETGRFLVGPYGYFLTRVVSRKSSRGKEICICDGGMNNHLAACGLMGMFLKRPWPMWNLSNAAEIPQGKFTITGPLCTTIDTLGRDAEMSEPKVGDIIAVGSSGAYGPTASPINFIGHPHPKEYLLRNGEITEVS
jgi:diaminopimelate decarboxylase